MAAKNKKIPSPLNKGAAKVPVVMQMETLECGAASLTMILAYYNKFLPLEQVRADCGVSRDGSSAKNILKAARSYGMEAKAYRFEPEDIVAHGTFPCIIHWNMNHFVVLDGFKNNHAVINDPAHGCVKVTMEDFNKSFTGIVMIITPGENFEPGGKPRSVVNYALSRLKGTGTGFALIILTTIIVNLLALTKPVFSRLFIDRILTGDNPDWLYPFTAALIGIAFINLIIQIINKLYLTKVEAKLAVISSTGFMWHILRLPMEFFSQRMAGDIASRQSSNESISAELMNTFAPLALDFVMMIVYLVVMLRYSVLLTFIGVASILINAGLAKIISDKRVNITRVQMRNSGRLLSMTMNGIKMIESLKASGSENGYFEKWAGYQANVNTQSGKYSRLNLMLGSLPDLVFSVTNAVILILGVYLTMQKQFTVGSILAFQGLMSSLTGPTSKLISSGQTMQETRTEMERIEDVTNYPCDSEPQSLDDLGDEIVTKLTGDIQLKNVTFGYSKLAEPLIRDFNLTLKPGCKVAFVGTSGCGKSTLSKLISGLYKPWSGDILFDGKPIGEVNPSVFHASVAVVNQDIVLFEDTIANNIKMWDASIEDFEMILAARDVQMHDYIMTRDGEYQHKILENGRNFSGGERQRIEIARALAQDPTIMILDEATSALDAETEFKVVQAIKNRGITCIIVAHRLSTIRDCDEIIVLDRGEVMERGTHDELIANGGLYSRLITNE